MPGPVLSPLGILTEGSPDPRHRPPARLTEPSSTLIRCCLPTLIWWPSVKCTDHLGKPTDSLLCARHGPPQEQWSNSYMETCFMTWFRTPFLPTATLPARTHKTRGRQHTQLLGWAPGTSRSADAPRSGSEDALSPPLDCGLTQPQLRGSTASRHLPRLWQ